MIENKDLDPKKKYVANYEFVHFADTPIGANGTTTPIGERKVFTVEKSWSGYTKDIALAVRNYMGQYGAIQGKLLGEMNEITNKKS